MSRRGPKPKPKFRKRTNRISVYYTPYELERISRIAGGRSRVSAFLRNAGFNRLPKTIPMLNQKAWAELSHTYGMLVAIMLRVRDQAEWVDVEEIKHALDQFRCALIGAKHFESEDN